jgi:hypothetical protein
MDVKPFNGVATAAIATPESDAKLRLREIEKGSLARRENLPRSACPWKGGVLQGWWLKGWDHPHHPASPVVTLTRRNKENDRW